METGEAERAHSVSSLLRNTHALGMSSSVTLLDVGLVSANTNDELGLYVLKGE